ncbi:protein-export chaperone SecB [Albirhodobacter sp. R86504]|jgi:preprotein translocase subunit SecB|uniref:protein-export chaperone SecB n=1 Tax=Albirhodobacter sp. R86504 TaxID=3093848 RepID=UPI00367189A7
MTEHTNGAAPQVPQVKMSILAQFIRDMSFENALAQKGLQNADVSPEIQVQVSLDARKRAADHQYEVSTKFRINSKNKNDDATLYLLELDYAGIFHVENVPEEHLHAFLLIECPRMIFPYVRRVVSDVTRDGGFPPFMLEPVDFAALYRQQMQRVAAEAQNTTADA